MCSYLSGGVILLNYDSYKESASNLFKNNIFLKNKAKIYGGGIFLQFTNSNNAVSVNLYENNFILNEAHKGGAIYANDSPKLDFKKNYFYFNRAIRGRYYALDDLKYLENITSSGGAL